MGDLVETVLEAEEWERVALADLAERSARATLAFLALDPERHEIAVLGCDDARIAALNTAFRGQPLPTDVLSWPSEERSAAREGEPPAAPAPGALGDIAIAYGTTAAEAAERGKPLPDHATHLLVHAVLHLLGYDHGREADALLMERTEAQILATLGIGDPYA